MKIGKLEPKTDLVLPPIAGFSDVGMRMLCKRFGAGLTFTEMVSAKGLVYGSENTKALLAVHPSEDIKGVQLFGREPGFFTKAIGMRELEPFDIIDINFGCPVTKIVKSGEGSALMKEPGLVHKIVKACVNAAGGREVTAKIRAGFSQSDKNAAEVAKACEDGGAAAVTVHGRTRDMMYSGEVDLEIIKKVKEAVTIPVIGNGDVTDRQSYLKMLEYTGADGAAIGRAAIGSPYIFSTVRGIDAGYDILGLIREHIEELLKHLPERVVVNNMKKHIAAYLKGIRGGKRVRTEIFHAQTVEEIYGLLNTVYS